MSLVSKLVCGLLVTSLTSAAYADNYGVSQVVDCDHAQAVVQRQVGYAAQPVQQIVTSDPYVPPVQQVVQRQTVYVPQPTQQIVTRNVYVQPAQRIVTRNVHVQPVQQVVQRQTVYVPQPVQQIVTRNVYAQPVQQIVTRNTRVGRSVVRQQVVTGNTAFVTAAPSIRTTTTRPTGLFGILLGGRERTETIVSP